MRPRRTRHQHENLIRVLGFSSQLRVRPARRLVEPAGDHAVQVVHRVQRALVVVRRQLGLRGHRVDVQGFEVQSLGSNYK